MEFFSDEVVVGITTANSERPFNVANPQFLARDVHNQFGELIDGHHFFRADVYRARKI